MEKKQLTVKEALEQGYTHYAAEGAEYNKRIDKIEPEYFGDEPVYLVDKDNSYHFTISAKSIEEWVVETLVGEQDEVSDPNGELSGLAAEANYQALADDINARMAVKSFSDITDILLVL